MERISYRPEECVEVTGLGRTTIFALLASGELESIKVGRARVIPADALRAFIARRRPSQTSQAQAAA